MEYPSEGDLQQWPPGTMVLQTDREHSNEIVLQPKPTNDPDDPFNWEPRRKYVNFALTCLYVLLVTEFLCAATPTWGPMHEQLDFSWATLNNSYAIGCGFLGIGAVFLTPVALKFGRRPLYLISITIVFAAGIWSAKMQKAVEIMLVNVLSCAAGALSEVMIQMTIADVFFVHQRGLMNAIFIWTVQIGGSLGPVVAGFVTAFQGWRWVWWWNVIFLGACLGLFAFFYEETKYIPPASLVTEFSSKSPTQCERKYADDKRLKNARTTTTATSFDEFRTPSDAVNSPPSTVSDRRKKTYRERLTLFTSSPELATIPGILYCALSYGAQVAVQNTLSTTMSSQMTLPPYNFTSDQINVPVLCRTGFFIDSYDLFIINLVSPVLQYEYWNGHYPSMLHGIVNAGANIGNVFGQILFGILADAFGRRFVYGKELIIGVVGIILVISLPNSIPTPTLKMIWLFCWRVFMGIGIGGDYPMSAAIVSERGHLHSRGALLAWIFSGQGWGTLLGSIITIIILACFEPALNGRREYSQLDAVWRIQIGVALIPALIVLPFRLTMPEGQKYIQSRKLNFKTLVNDGDDTSPKQPSGSEPSSSTANVLVADSFSENPHSSAACWKTFLSYFSEWRHLKTLLGTASTWFLLDIAFYGTNLNQSVILSEIGFSHGRNIYHTLMRNALGNLIIAVAGYVPGYFFTIFFIERLGRRWIQIQGFLICALLFGVLAGHWDGMNTAGRFVCFALAQFFFNFGPNVTTFIIPAEVFPSRVRGTAHGISAASGKLGAILSALLFNWLSSSVIGLPNVLWIFFGCNILGAVATWFLIPETKGRDADLIDVDEIQA